MYLYCWINIYNEKSPTWSKFTLSKLIIETLVWNMFKSAMNTADRRHLRRTGVFIVNF